MNHAFYDANKRTAFLTLLLFLNKINRVPKVSKTEFEDFLVKIANKSLSKGRRYQELILRNSPEDAEVYLIAEYLQKNTRRRDSAKHSITYRDLDRLLRKHGFSLISPSGNRITVVQESNHRSIFLKWAGRQKALGTIGFPSMSKQVPRGELDRVRKLTGLTEQNGYDSAVFLGEYEPLALLIEEYYEQLLSLADR